MESECIGAGGQGPAARRPWNRLAGPCREAGIPARGGQAALQAEIGFPEKEIRRMDLIETVIGSDEIYAGKVVHLRVDRVRLPNGKESKREVVAHRGAVCIVPVLNGEVLMVRQFRLPAGKVLLEIPAGTLEAGENPDDCAARELEEETGFKASSIVPLFSAYLAPGYSTELIHAYLASGLTEGSLHLDADENVVLERIPLAEIERMILAGELQDSKTISAVLVALRRLGRQTKAPGAE